jgi:hypothetical protein
MTEILPRSADVLWELAKDRKKSRGAGRDQTVTNNQGTHDRINPMALEIL